MHVISRKPFSDAAKRFPNKAPSIDFVYRLLSKHDFDSPEAMREIFVSLDNFKYQTKWWVIDIGGNQLRLIAFIDFVHHKVFVKHICDHKTYDALCESYRKISK